MKTSHLIMSSFSALLVLTPFQDAQAVFGWVQLYKDNVRLVSEARRATTFMLDEAHAIAQVFDPVPWQHYGDVWAYVDDTGQLRATASTGDARGTQPLSGRATAIWEGTFSKDTLDDAPVFTINPADLVLFAPFPQTGGVDIGSPPNSFARWQIDIAVCSEGELGPVICNTILQQRTTLAGGNGSLGSFYTVSRTQNISIIDSQSGSLTNGNAAGGPITGLLDWGMSGDPVVYSTSTHDLTIPLPDQLVGETYTLTAQVSAEVYLATAGYEGNSVAEAIVANLADVLASNSGLQLNDAGTAVTDTGRLCATDYDALRFVDNQDGSVLDQYTSLIWQRCPLGFSLDDNGTPSVIEDDHCQITATEEYDWQSALQAADADTLGSSTEWRLPNVKELETLVAECITPAIEPLPFPDTPAVLFWTATPAGGDAEDQSWLVDFLSGGLSTADRTTPANARLVRTSTEQPQMPLPFVTIGRAGVIEGDTGVTQLVYPILLSQPLATDVWIDFEVTGLSATEGEDFLGTSGTLLIPAEDVLGHVAVVVNGDTQVEGGNRRQESVRLALSNASDNIRLAQSVAFGHIFDDEPVLTIRHEISAQIAEGDVTQTFIVALDRPAVESVTFDYMTLNQSATEGSDYGAQSGTLTLFTGDTEAQIIVDILHDDQHENDEQFSVVISNLVGNVRLGLAAAESTIVDDDHPGTFSQVNDTGIDYCVTEDSSQTGDPCPTPGYPGQDGDTGRDATDHNPDDGPAGFSFTKLDDTGIPLIDQTQSFDVEPWACVHDNVTGLTWEIKNQSFPRDLHYLYWNYTWHNPTGVNDGGDPGFMPALGGAQCWDTTNCDDPTNPRDTLNCDEFEPMQCDTQTFVQQVNEQNYCGHNDWRLPTVDEGLTLINLNPNEAPLPNGFFVGALGGSYWSSTTDAADPSSAWHWTPGSGRGISAGHSKTIHAPVRLVRGGSHQ